MTDHQDFAAALRQSGLRQVDLARLTGRDRRTVWRWCRGKTEAPDYAWTIIRQQQRIKQMAWTMADDDQ